MKGGAGFFIALRYLLGRAREGGRYLRGAAAGIALSLVPIMVTLIAADGMIRGITDRYLELGTGHLQIYGFEGAPDLEDARTRLEPVKGIRGAWLERQGLGVLAGKSGKAGTTIRAVESAFWEDEGSARFLTTLSGENRPESDGEVVLGDGLARAIGAETGDTIRIMTVRISSGGRNIPRLTPFKVRGIVSAGYRELDSLWCIMTYAAGSRILPPEVSRSFLTVKIDDPYGAVDEMAGLIASLLDMNYGVFTWKTLKESQYSSYESTRQLLLFIMALVVIVAAVNVSSATSMLALERRRDIAVLKAFGTGPGAAGRIFLWGSFLTGLTGAVLGIGLGLLLGCCINPVIHGLEGIIGFFSGLSSGGAGAGEPGYYLEAIPVIIDWSAVALIGVFTVLCAVLASLLPARRAGKLSPTEILRKY